MRFRSKIVLGVALGTMAVSADGGWSADPDTNLVIADRVQDQVHPKLAPTGDGGFYVGWYDDAAGGYDVALQRLDAAGVELWGHNGIIVADTGFEWVEAGGYDLTVDAAGDALLAFCDDRGGTEHITVARIAPDGTMPWGEDGVVVDAGPVRTAPAIASTTDDQVVVAWSHDKAIRVRRLDLAGRAVWPAGVTIASMQNRLGPQAAIVRCMPNTPALLGCGASGLFANDNCSAQQREFAQRVLAAVGITCWVDREEALHSRSVTSRPAVNPRATKRP